MKPNSEAFHAVCRGCGTLSSTGSDNTFCECGGVFHVDSARCLSCGGRHSFGRVGQKCACGGEIAPKAVICPVCETYSNYEHLGEFCPGCNVELKLEG